MVSFPTGVTQALFRAQVFQITTDCVVDQGYRTTKLLLCEVVLLQVNAVSDNVRGNQATVATLLLIS